MSTDSHFTFPLSEGIVREKVHFKNRFGIKLTADLYIPVTAFERDSMPAIAVSGPYGAVKGNN